MAAIAGSVKPPQLRVINEARRSDLRQIPVTPRQLDAANAKLSLLAVLERREGIRIQDGVLHAREGIADGDRFPGTQ